MKRSAPRILIAVAAPLLLLSASSLAGNQPKTTSMKGKVFRSDTRQPIANATIVLLDEKKSDQQDNSIDTKTDDQGNYSFPNVVVGAYTVSIRAWYSTQENAPCQLLMAKTADKNSTVAVIRDKDKFVQVFIKGFSIKAGKKSSRISTSHARVFLKSNLLPCGAQSNNSAISPSAFEATALHHISRQLG